MLVSGRLQMEGREKRKEGREGRERRRDEGKKEGSQIHFFPVFHSLLTNPNLTPRQIW